MKISELITQLTKIKDWHSDVEVMMNMGDGFDHCDEIRTITDLEMHRAEKAGGDYTVPRAVVLLPYRAWERYIDENI